MNSEWFAHLGYVLVALSFMVRDMLMLRIVSIAGSVALLLWSVFDPSGPLWAVIEWNVAFIAVHVVQIIILIREKMSVSFTEEEKEMYATVFRNFSPVEFMKLIRVGEWESVDNDATLTVEGQTVSSIMLVYNGSATVRAKGKEIAALKDGDFIGEMSFTTDAQASATVITTEPTRLFVWPKNDLKRLLNRNPVMRVTIQGVLGTDMAKKLKEKQAHLA